jgi:hypothetical protein
MQHDTHTVLASARERLDEVRIWVDDFAADSDTRLIYVFDTDVITLYSRPSIRSNYAALLRSEPDARRAMNARLDGAPCTPLDECEIALADLLGNHIVWSKEQAALNSPILAKELETNCIQVWLKAEKQLDAMRERLRQDFFNLNNTYPTNADEEAKRLWIEERTHGTLNKLESETPDALEALRLQQAFDNERIYSLESFCLSSDGAAEAVFLPSAYDETTGDVRPEIQALGRQLLQILISGYSLSDYKLKRMRDDATAVAHLCWLNQQMEAAERPERIRLVTGTIHLHRLKDVNRFAGTKLPQELKKTLEKLAPELKDLLRHPLGFLEDQGIRSLLTLEQGEVGTEGMGGRLGAFLAGKINRKVSCQNVSHPEEHGDRREPEDASEMEKLLNDATSDCGELLRAALARQFVRPEKSWLAKLISDIISDSASEWDSLIEKRISTLLPNFLASLATIQASSRSLKVARNLPPLSMVNPQAASTLCARLYQDHCKATGLAKESRELLAQVIANDRSLYTPLLMLALWRAMEKDWKSTRSLAENACEIADTLVKARLEGSDSSDATIYGEEAYYLNAVAKRLTAGKIHNSDAIGILDSALKDIGVAEDRHKLYRDKHLSENSNVEFRHASERISIELAKRFYQRLGEKAAFNPVKERELFDVGYVLLEKLLNIHQSANDQNYLLQFVRQQICVSLSQLILLDRYAVSGLEVFPIVARSWSRSDDYSSKVEYLWHAFNQQCELLDFNAKQQQNIHSSPVVSSLVKLVWKAFMLEINSVNLAERESIMEEVKKCSDPHNYVAGIDEPRFNFLYKIAIRHLSAR